LTGKGGWEIRILSLVGGGLYRLQEGKDFWTRINKLIVRAILRQREKRSSPKGKRKKEDYREKGNKFHP